MLHVNVSAACALPALPGADIVGYAAPALYWPVGELSLLQHWLDVAVNTGAHTLVLHAPPGLSSAETQQLRAYLNTCTLWPVHIKLQKGGKLPQAAVCVFKLPFITAEGEGALPVPLQSAPPGWGTLHRWHKLEQAWLQNSWQAGRGILPPAHTHVGRGTRIHPSANLVPPYYIGNNVCIGPACTVGGGAAVHSGSLLEGHSTVRAGHIGPKTYLGAHTCVEHAALLAPHSVLVGKRTKGKRACKLFDFEAGTHLQNLEPHIAAAL